MTSREKFVQAIIISCLLYFTKIFVNNSESLLQLKNTNSIFKLPPTSAETHYF